MNKRSSWKMLPAAAICLIQILPLYITLTVALKGPTDLSSYWSLPAQAAWGNFARAFEAGGLLRASFNSIVITSVSTFLVIVLAAAAAYPLARNRSRLNAVVKTFVLSILMVPALSLLVPLYVLIVKAKAVSTYWGIIPVHLTFNLPLAIYMYSNFIGSMPRELDEAALIDGCSGYRIFWDIILPLLKPVTVSVIILTSVAVWNDFQYSLYFLQKPTMRVLTLAIASFFGLSGSDPHVAAAGALLAILPVTVIYLFLQKYFVKGMVDGAIK
jgi:raffinose/stachyose/melibiose transport system permease protein